MYGILHNYCNHLQITQIHCTLLCYSQTGMFDILVVHGCNYININWTMMGMVVREIEVTHMYNNNNNRSTGYIICT